MVRAGAPHYEPFAAGRFAKWKSITMLVGPAAPLGAAAADKAICAVTELVESRPRWATDGVRRRTWQVSG